jgi:hypothetical protein
MCAFGALTQGFLTKLVIIFQTLSMKLVHQWPVLSKQCAFSHYKPMETKWLNILYYLKAKNLFRGKNLTSNPLFSRAYLDDTKKVWRG